MLPPPKKVKIEKKWTPPTLHNGNPFQKINPYYTLKYMLFTLILMALSLLIF